MRHPARPSVAIITDSTAALPPESIRQYGIRVIPLQLRIGDRTTDESKVGLDEVLDALHREVPVRTAEPPSPEFFWAYHDAIAAGYREVVSLHISGRLSATAASARDAAERCPFPVHVVDTLTAGMSLGFLAMAAADAAWRGATGAEVVYRVKEQQRRMSQMIYVDTLEYLRRGGRIGKAAALLGTAFSIKPLLGLADGEIVPLARVSGTNRALARLVDEAANRSSGAPVNVGVEYFGAPERAQLVADRLRRKLPKLRNVVITRSSAVLAAHVGPGGIGLAVSPC